MKLSNIYNSTHMWALVCSTGFMIEGDVEVEFICSRFFESEDNALEWFNKHKRVKDFINPRAVLVKGFNDLKLS